jgi:NodT family efflux transporter outer membrane factor (OMF) lipoprotein
MGLLVRSFVAKRIRGTAATACLVAALLSMTGCGIPKLRCAQPGPILPETFNGSTTSDNSSQVGIDEFFNDSKLTGLINQALLGNQELRILNEDVVIARNEIIARRGAYLPFVTIGGGAGIDKPSRFTREGAVEDQLQVAPGKSFPNPLANYLLATSLYWQLDIWKMLRNSKNAAVRRYLATSEGRTYAVTKLVAEIAEDYFGLMAADMRLETLDRTIKLQEQSLEIAKAKKLQARGNELAVQRFQAEVRKNQSEKLIINQEIVELENRINFRVGRYPQPVERSTENFIDLNMKVLSVGVPSQLLANRPDIRQAERELAASGLDVKVARARFFPSVAITAGVGYAAFNPKYLISDPESLIYNVAGDLVAPLINKLAIKADYMSANAKQLQSVYNYQRVILNAFTEVINRVSKVENYRQSIEIKKQQLEALEASVDVASKLFQNARAEYMDVLFSQRDLMDARMVLIETKLEQLSAVVNAYQALGGGATLVVEPDFAGAPAR